MSATSQDVGEGDVGYCVEDFLPTCSLAEFLFLCILLHHMVIRMRHTRAHTKNRRSHHALTSPHLVKCEHCTAWKLLHRVCMECGWYRDRQVIDVVAKTARKQSKLKARQEN